MTKAIILCAGKGTRLKDMTKEIPKPMISFNKRPLLQYHIEWFKKYGVDEIFINLHYLPDTIKDYFGDGSRFGVKIKYFYENELKGTAGALNGFRKYLNDAFFVQYGDVYNEIDLKKMLEFHKKNNSDGTLVLQPTERPHDSDIVKIDENNRIVSLHHKPGSFEFGNLGNAAFYILEPKVLDYLPEEGESDFVQDIFPNMLKDEKMSGYMTEEYMEDIGTFDRYEKLRKRLER